MESLERSGTKDVVGLVDIDLGTLGLLLDPSSDQQLDKALRRVTEPIKESAHAAVSAFNSHI